MSRPVVALVGRTNVGKSTLMNRILGVRHAVVDDRPNVTRDRLIVPVSWGGRDIVVVDTGGWGVDAESPLDVKVKHQAEVAVAQADVILLVVSAPDGVISSDVEAANLVRAAGKKCVLVVNKVDHVVHETLTADFHRLGIESVVSVSALHNRGLDELMTAVVRLLPPVEPKAPLREGSIRLAIVGRPNAGKSTLLNALAGAERAIVDETPGTTRDPLDAELVWEGKSLVLVDTAGIRKKTRVTYGVDYFSVLRALQAIDRCDVAVLVLDATEPATAQDVTIARYVQEAGRGLVLVVNKWDLVPPDRRDAHRDWMRQRLDFLSFVPVVHVSALQRRHVKSVLQKAVAVAIARRQVLSRSVVDAAIEQSVERHAPPMKGTRRLDIVWAHQEETEPWKFVLHVNDPALVPSNYPRYLEHDFRRQFGFHGVPLLFEFVPAGRRPRRKEVSA
ncbi:MAG: ribosome biogenesis GTPase Der [Dehalococcoidia bacterium]|nr:ribosome biogenesis GTPase Der [Dehalococcoidia bacterium]